MEDGSSSRRSARVSVGLGLRRGGGGQCQLTEQHLMPANMAMVIIWGWGGGGGGGEISQNPLFIYILLMLRIIYFFKNQLNLFLRPLNVFLRPLIFFRHL